MGWPRNSPNLDQIENVWSQIKHLLSCIVHKVLRGITGNYLENLYQSLPHRMQGVLGVRGGHIKYWDTNIYYLRQFSVIKWTRTEFSAFFILDSNVGKWKKNRKMIKLDQSPKVACPTNFKLHKLYLLKKAPKRTRPFLSPTEKN